MSGCPRCGNSITEDFGIVECSKCGALLVVEMDGSVQLSNAGGGQGAESNDPMGAYPVAPSNDDLLNELTSEIQRGTQPRSQSIPSIPQSMALPMDGGLESFDGPPNNYEKTILTQPQSGLPSRPADPAESLAEIQSFGNQDVVSGTQGNLLYHIAIRGIDSGDLRDQVIDVLSDRKLRLDIEDLKKKIKNGELKVGPVTSVKASVVVQNLIHLPVFIEWTQHSVLKESF